MRLTGGKTLVQAGHVSPRFWEITKFLHTGGGAKFVFNDLFDDLNSIKFTSECVYFNKCM